MKQGKTLKELAIELEEQLKTKRDYIAPTSRLAMSPHAALEIDGVGEFSVTDLAHEQIAARLDIPRKYYDRMKIEEPALLSTNVNRWLQKADDKRMVRTIGGTARAFLSDRFRALDNYDLASAVLPKLSELDCRVESSELTEKRLYIKAVCPKIEGIVKVGDTVQAGLCISNSEVGCGSLSVEFLAFRLACRNGAISVNSFRKYHVGKRGGDDLDLAQEFYRSETRVAEDKAFWMKVTDLVAGALSKEGFDKILAGYQRAAVMWIENDPSKTVELLAKNAVLNDTERGSILKYLAKDGDLSLYGLMNAVTRTAQDVTDYDRATELERLGGEIVEMPARDWEAYATAQ